MSLCNFVCVPEEDAWLVLVLLCALFVLALGEKKENRDGVSGKFSLASQSKSC
jgi:hypothetical protein